VSIYHLHIPRTSGIYVKNNVLPHLITGGVPHFVSNRTHIDIDKISNSKFVGGHFGLMPLDYMDNPEIFTVLRNPVDRFISYFKYTTGRIRMGQEAEEKKYQWLYGEESKIQSNSQSKFLTGRINIDKFNNGIHYLQENVKNHWFLEDYSLNLNDVLTNVDKFYSYSLDNQNIFLEDLNKALYKNFGFNTFKYKDKANCSPEIGVVFSKKDIDRIIELNELDMQVYEYVQKSKKRY
jgi:hypothetical protein